MGSPADLTLGYRAQSPLPVAHVFKAGPSGRDQTERCQLLDEYLKALEDERRKIEAFKRELPHCMQLLDYAIEASTEHIADSRPSCTPRHPFVSLPGKRPSSLGLFGKEMVEEFLKVRWEALRKDSEEEKEKGKRSSSGAEGERPSWMAEAQLWSQPSFRSDHRKEKESSTEDSVRRQKDSAEQSTLTSPALLFNSKQRPGGAFMPFVKEKPVSNSNLVIRTKAGVAATTGADFTITSGESRPSTAQGFGAVESDAGSVEVSTRVRDVSVDISQGRETVGRLNGGGSYSGGTGSTTSGGGNAQRKARRCWSPELHRRFVTALQQLGGSQIATPKQIRELMKVDGLTNDEVKSHLQKYRLHTRRPSPTLQVPPQQTPPQLVVLGGIWVPPEYGNAGIYHDPSSSVSQQDPRFCQPSHSQEFYSQLHPSNQIELHRSPSHSSPNGPLQSTSNPSSGGAHQTSGEVYREDSGAEDGKSESSSWKGDRENNSQRSLEKEEKQSSREEEEEDTEDENDGKGNGMRLQLEMSCSSGQTEPQSASQHGTSKD